MYMTLDYSSPLTLTSVENRGMFSTLLFCVFERVLCVKWVCRLLFFVLFAISFILRIFLIFFLLNFYRFNFIIHWLGLSSALLCDVRKKIEEKIQPHNLLTSQIEWSIKLLNWHRDWKHLLDQALQWKSHKQTDKDFSLVNNAIQMKRYNDAINADSEANIKKSVSAFARLTKITNSVPCFVRFDSLWLS